MAKKVYSIDERKEQFLKAGVRLARKNGISAVHCATVAKANKVSAPLVFHVFGNRKNLRDAVIAEAERLGVELRT